MKIKVKGQIITLAELKEEGKRVAFIKGNRMVQEKNVNAKWASLREYGQCTPAVIIDGGEVRDRGCRNGETCCTRRLRELRGHTGRAA